MARKQEIKEEIEGIAPRLASLSGNDVSEQVPEGYFSELGDQLNDRLFSIERENDSRVRKLWTLTGLLAAASIALFMLTRVPVPDVNYPQEPELTATELFYMDEFETDELEGLLSAYEAEEFDAESILLEETDLEDLLNI